MLNRFENMRTALIVMFQNRKHTNITLLFFSEICICVFFFFAIFIEFAMIQVKTVRV